ncbi:MAG: CoA transferase, partial [Rickettsiales bacterium]
LCKVIGREDMVDDPRLANGDLRFQHQAEVDKAITDWTMQHTKTEVMEAIASQKVPCGAVYNTYELMRDEDFLKRGMMQEIEQPKRGKVTVAGWPLQMSGSRVPIKPAPLHGGNNEDVYGEWLGIAAEEVKAMRERGEI